MSDGKIYKFVQCAIENHSVGVQEKQESSFRLGNHGVVAASKTDDEIGIGSEDAEKDKKGGKKKKGPKRVTMSEARREAKRRWIELRIPTAADESTITRPSCSSPQSLANCIRPNTSVLVFTAATSSASPELNVTDF